MELQFPQTDQLQGQYKMIFVYVLLSVSYTLNFILLYFLFNKKKTEKPVGGFLVNLDEDGSSARIGVALYKTTNINDILQKDTITLKVDSNIDFFNYYEDSKEKHSL